MSNIPFLKSNDIESFYEEGDRIIVEGIAADTSRDLVGDVASKTFLRKLASDLPGRSVFYNHNYKMPPVGRVIETKLMDDDNRLWAKCELYPNQDNLKHSLMDGSLRFYSVGGVGSKVRHDVVGGLPTRIFEDGYGQELTITSVPINPTASYIRVAKAWQEEYNKSQTNPVVYNISNYTDFVKSVKDIYNVDILEERNRIENEMEETFMKGTNGAIMNPERINDSGHVSGGMDNLNGRGQVSSPSHWTVPDGQLKAVDVIRKAWDEANSWDDFANRVEFMFARGFGYDRLNGVGQTPGKDNFGGQDGFMARVVDEGLRSLARQATGQPNYGTQPDDHKYLVSHIPTAPIDYRGYDDQFVNTEANRTPLKSPDPIGTGKNPGVNPLDQEFLSRGMKPLPPAFRTNGYVNSGLTTVRKAEDLLEDERFVKSLGYSEYTGQMGRGANESEVYYIWRLLHERGPITEGSPFQKAIDGEITTSINTADFDNPTIEEAAVLELISRDPHLGDVFYKCIQDSIYGDLEEEEAETDTYEKALPPWLEEKDGKVVAKGKGKKGEDKDDDEDDDKKDEKKDKKVEKKSASEDKEDDEDDEDEEEEEEEEDEDENKDEKKDDKKDDKDYDKSYVKSVISDSIRQHLERAQNETQAAGRVTPDAGVSTDTGFKLGRFEQSLLDVLGNGGSVE